MKFRKILLSALSVILAFSLSSTFIGCRKKTVDRPIVKKQEEKRHPPEKELPEQFVVPDSSFDRSPPRGGAVIQIPNCMFDKDGRPLNPDDYPNNFDEFYLQKVPNPEFLLHPASKGEKSSIVYLMLGEKADLLIIEFWSMENEESKRELPYLESLSSTFRDSIKVLGVSIDAGDVSTQKKLDAVLKNDKSMEQSWSELGKYPKIGDSYLTFPIAVDGAEMAKQFSITTYPTTLVVTKDLRLYHKFEGFSIDKMNKLQGKIMKYLRRNGSLD